jgi:hypothetical protein
MIENHSKPQKIQFQLGGHFLPPPPHPQKTFIENIITPEWIDPAA